MGLVLVTPPSREPVTLAEAKAHLRVDFDDDDDLIMNYIRAATSHLDGPRGIIGRALMPQTWDLFYDTFPCNELRIPLLPLISIDSVNYIGSAGTEVLLPDTEYEVDAASYYGWVVPGTAGWPTPFETKNALRVRFTAGYPDQDSPPNTTVPEPIRHAILMLLSDWYPGVGTAVVGTIVSSMPIAVDRLVAPYRVYPEP